MEQKQSLLFDGWVSLSTKQSSKLVLDMVLGPQQQLSIHEDHSGANQQFRVVKGDYGLVSFRLRSSGKALTIQQQSEDDGARIIQDQFLNTPNQKFRMAEMSPHSGEYIIYTFCGKVFDVCGGVIKKGSIVFQYSFNGGNNQLWKVRQSK